MSPDNNLSHKSKLPTVVIYNHGETVNVDDLLKQLGEEAKNQSNASQSIPDIDPYSENTQKSTEDPKTD